MSQQQITCVCTIADQVREICADRGITHAAFVAEVGRYMQTDTQVRMIAALIRHGAVTNDDEPLLMLSDIQNNLAMLDEAVAVINPEHGCQY